MKLSLLGLISALLLPVAAAAAAPTDTATPSLRPFVATYQVLRGGDAMGTGTLSLVRNPDGSWTFVSRVKATSGMAAMLGTRLEESSHFREHDGRLESLAYDYAMHVAVVDKSRKLRVDWTSKQVTVHTGKPRTYHYKAVPGLVERHLQVLALGQAVAAGRTSMKLPVAVKNRVEMQTFRAYPAEEIRVPAGRFQAVRVDRTHDDKGWSAWYVPSRYGRLPVKLSQSGDADIILLLIDCRRP